MIKSALEIFERLELWEDVISCHQALSQEKKAEEILNKLLEENPESPKFWCILGDIKKDPEMWKKSWTISGNRYARSMRALAAYHFKRQEYQESIDAYELALAINPLYENSWFVLGCAAMRIENWHLAIKSFTRVVNIEPDVF